MLTINNLSLSYGKKNVLSDLSLNLDSGRIHGIVGYNGAGKTTLLNAIYGLPHRHKEIGFHGEILCRKKIAYLDAEPFFYSNITGRDYLGIFQANNSGFDYEGLCALFNVPIDKYIDSYSTGMKKKLAIIGVLSMEKEIILLDEPFNGLDLESVAALQMALKKLAAKGKTIIVTSHIMESLTPICDTILHLQNQDIHKTYLPDEYEELTRQIKNHIESKYNDSLDRIFK